MLSFPSHGPQASPGLGRSQGHWPGSQVTEDALDCAGKQVFGYDSMTAGLNNIVGISVYQCMIANVLSSLKFGSFVEDMSNKFIVFFVFWWEL